MTPRPRKTIDWDCQYRPAPGTPLLVCQCGAAYLDDEPCRQAHQTVFGHPPVRETQ